MYGNKEENECSFVSSMKTVFVAFSRVIRLKVESYFRQLYLTSYTKINPKHSEFLKKLTLVTSIHSGRMRPPASVREGGVCLGVSAPLTSWDTSPCPLHAGIQHPPPPPPRGQK